MVGQSTIQALREGDRVPVILHRGALKRGGDAVFTSFGGFRVGSGSVLNDSMNEIENDDL